MSEATEDAATGTVRLRFDQGTLVADGALTDADISALEALSFRRDSRAGGAFRAPAQAYRRTLAHLIRAGHTVDDSARQYKELTLAGRRDREPYPHQAEALAAWWKAGRRGVVVLPTGAGKTYVAEMAIGRVNRSTLVVA
ncbi:MAG: ATP-dependent helicase YprA (DUF1998 family), partial [Myxococcota bacterium]